MKMEKQLGAQDSQLSRGESDKVTEGATWNVKAVIWNQTVGVGKTLKATQ
jgi:hypothetical protein